MTLFRQIALLVSLMIVLLLFVVAWSDFKRSGEYLQGQLQSNAQDMATVLGLTVANSDRDDIAALETLFNAFFDSGYYTLVSLEAPDGALIHEKRQQVVVKTVPQWFVEFVPLQAATGSSQVMKGWRIYGTLSVTLHPGFAYASLYQNFKSMLFWVMLFALFGLLALWGMLFVLMKPLRMIQEQADAIHENQFIIQANLPRTLELRQVASAVNRMVTKVQSVFDEQTDILKRYHTLQYEDDLTGLGNRRYFMMKLNEVCEQEGEAGWIAIFHLNGLIEMNKALGYQATDDFIRCFVDALRRAAEGQVGLQCVRLKPSEFAFYTSGSEDEAKAAVERLFDWFRAQSVAESLKGSQWVCAGLAGVADDDVVSDVLSKVDFALANAKGAGAYGFVCLAGQSQDLPQGKEAWRSFLETSLAANQFFLVGQPVRNLDGSLYQREVFVRLSQEEQGVIAAGTFMPIASELGLDMAIDKAVFEMLMYLKGSGETVPVAVNLSRTFLSRADALSVFEEFVGRYSREVKVPLYVEMNHFDMLAFEDTAAHIAALLKSLNHSLGIDRLDLGKSLQPLKHIVPHYVKINANQLVDMADGEIQAGFTALRTLAGSLDMKLIAVAVDSEQVYQRMENLGVDAVQGNYVAKPERVE